MVMLTKLVSDPVMEALSADHFHHRIIINKKNIIMEKVTGKLEHYVQYYNTGCDDETSNEP